MAKSLGQRGCGENRGGHGGNQEAGGRRPPPLPAPAAARADQLVRQHRIDGQRAHNGLLDAASKVDLHHCLELKVCAITSPSHTHQHGDNIAPRDVNGEGTETISPPFTLIAAAARPCPRPHAMPVTLPERVRARKCPVNSMCT